MIQPYPRDRIWVVEMQLYGEWQATVGIALTRSDAVYVLRSWRSRNPDDDFRITQYQRVKRT